MATDKEDLGIKIGTKPEAEWTKIKESQEESLLANKINQEIAEVVIKLAESKIAEEQKV
jgi:hypothetical protein